MAEEFTLEQALGQHSTVDRHEGALAALAVLVEKMGDQFLAGAALALDQHGVVGGRHRAQGLDQLLHHRSAADDFAALVAGDPFLELDVLADH